MTGDRGVIIVQNARKQKYAQHATAHAVGSYNTAQSPFQPRTTGRKS